MDSIASALARKEYLKLWHILVVVPVFILLCLGINYALEYLRPPKYDGSAMFWSPSDLLWGEEGAETALLPVRDDKGLFGYADAGGNIVIPCAYDAARPFHEGLAAVKKDKRWGYIDPTGSIAIPFRYFEAESFRGGRAFAASRLARTQNDEAAFSLIDRAGRNIRDMGTYEYITYRGGGYVVAKDGHTVAYLDTDGNVLMELPVNTSDIIFAPSEHSNKRYFHGYGFFSDGLAAVRFGIGGGSGAYFMDKQGNAATGDFMGAYDFSEGLAAVWPGDPKTNKIRINETAKDAPGPKPPWGYIDTNGAFAIAAVYDKAFPFGDGLAVVKKQNGAWAVINHEGREVSAIRGTFDTAKSFREGLCAVGIAAPEVKWHGNRSYQYLWGFIDAFGEVVVPCVYNDVTAFDGGVAEVMLEGRIGYIDRAGEYIWEPK